MSQCVKCVLRLCAMASQHTEGTEMKALGNAVLQVRTPKRVLHFSDGTLEEYSDDDDEDTAAAAQDVGDSNRNATPLIDPKTLTWGPWISYMAWSIGASTLSACDYVGETLADFFGITSPKYFYEIQEYERRQAADKELREQHGEGWCEAGGADEANLVTKDPPHRGNMVAPTEALV